MKRHELASCEQHGRLSYAFERSDMTDQEGSYEINDPETFYAQGRVTHRTYASKTFPLKRTNSADDGSPARFLWKVLDPSTETKIDRSVDEWTFSDTPGGRYQIKVLIAREVGNVKELWVQRVPAPGKSGSTRTLLNLQQPETTRLIDFLRIIEQFPVEGDTSARIDDSVIRELLSDPDALARVYRRDPSELQKLIQSDANATDVIALEARRAQVEKFRRLLEDDEFFAAEVALTAHKRSEDVWQQLFESNPWMLGVALTGQLLTAWDDRRLEQLVAAPMMRQAGKRTDALMRTTGRIRSMVFAEIKTHKTPLLDERRAYRSGCWSASDELTGAVAQSQGTVHRAVMQIGERIQGESADGTELAGDITYLLRPRSFVIAGQLSQFLSIEDGHHRDKIRSFELFRRHLQQPELLTFDEVLARAEWAVALAAADTQ